MKIYAASLAAFSQLDPRAPEDSCYVEGQVFITSAESIEIASENVKVKGLTDWPIAKGWYRHQAVIESVPADLIRLAYADLEDQDSEEKHQKPIEIEFGTDDLDWPILVMRESNCS